MSWIDFVIIGIVVISTLLSLLRGFVREALSTANLIGSFAVAILFGAKFAVLLGNYIQHDLTRELAARLILFFASLIVFGIANLFLRRIIKFTGIGENDKVLGLMFGVLRGLIVVVAIAFLLEIVAPQSHWDNGTLLAGGFRDVAIWIKVKFLG